MPGARRPATRLASLAIVALLVIACGTGSDSGDGSAAPGSPGAAVIVTFEVVGEERFKVLLTDAVDIEVANRLIAGEDVASIPNGRVVRETGVNEGWSWSLDPNDFEFADVTIEVCDGVPSDVEAGLVTSDRYCPWSAIIVDLQPAP